MYQSIGVPKVIEELIAEAFALVCAGNESSDVEEFDGYAPNAVLAGAVVGFASLL